MSFTEIWENSAFDSEKYQESPPLTTVPHDPTLSGPAVIGTAEPTLELHERRTHPTSNPDGRILTLFKVLGRTGKGEECRRDERPADCLVL